MIFSYSSGVVLGAGAAGLGAAAGFGAFVNDLGAYGVSDLTLG